MSIYFYAKVTTLLASRRFRQAEEMLLREMKAMDEEIAKEIHSHHGYSYRVIREALRELGDRATVQRTLLRIEDKMRAKEAVEKGTGRSSSSSGGGGGSKDGNCGTKGPVQARAAAGTPPLAPAPQRAVAVAVPVPVAATAAVPAGFSSSPAPAASSSPACKTSSTGAGVGTAAGNGASTLPAVADDQAPEQIQPHYEDEETSSLADDSDRLMMFHHH